jgi:peptide/nickel transport system ATP-binding protein
MARPAPREPDATGVVSPSRRGEPRVTILAKEALLEVRGLRVWFPVKKGVLQRTSHHVRAVEDVDLTLYPGETLALVGESGCGKTTVGKSILGLTDATAGNIWFQGSNLTLMGGPARQALRRHIQVVMQDPASALDPRMTVRDCIAEGLDSFRIGDGAEARTAMVATLMRQVSLDPETMWRYPHEFSGGQRQRICIARALAVDPTLLICDEATSALDVSIQAQILNLLADLQRARKLTRVAVMYLGRIVETGRTDRIFASPQHPYTQALLASVPSLDPDKRSDTKPLVMSDIPSPEHPPDGCHYHPRCAVRLPQCAREVPPPFPLADGICRCVRVGVP